MASWTRTEPRGDRSAPGFGRHATRSRHGSLQRLAARSRLREGDHDDGEVTKGADSKRFGPEAIQVTSDLVGVEPAPGPETSLGRTAARGTGLLLAGQGIRGAAQLLGVVVLSRILDPNVFGIAAVAAVFVGLGELIRDAGMSVAALRAPEMSARARSGLFWLNSIIGVICCLLTFFVAPVVVRGFGLEIEPLALQALGGVLLINGIAAQYRADLLRSMKFRPIAVADALAAILSLAAAIGLAVAGAGYWALIAQLIANSLVASTVAIIVGRWRPSSPRSLGATRPYLRFAGGVTVSQVFSYSGNNVDVVAMSALASVASLGIYNRAFQIVMAPITMVQLPIQNGLVPALSRAREDRQKYSDMVERAQLAVGVVVLPIPAMLAATCPGLVPIALGDGWTEAITPVWFLSGAAALQVLAATANWILITDGKGERLMTYSLVSLGVRCALILPAASHGATYVAAAYFASTLILWPAALIWASSRSAIRTGPVMIRSALMFGAYLIPAALGGYLADRASSQFLAVAVGVAVTSAMWAMLLASPTVRSTVKSILRSRK